MSRPVDAASYKRHPAKPAPPFHHSIRSSGKISEGEVKALCQIKLLSREAEAGVKKDDPGYSGGVVRLSNTRLFQTIQLELTYKRIEICCHEHYRISIRYIASVDALDVYEVVAMDTMQLQLAPVCVKGAYGAKIRHAALIPASAGI